MSDSERHFPDKVLSAITKRQLPKLRKLLANGGIDLEQVVENRLPLVEAVDHGVDFVQALLDAGAAVNGCIPDGTTALIRAAERGNVPVLTVLLAAGADPSRMQGTVLSPLIAAARRRSREHLDALMILIAHGADVNGLSRSLTGSPTSSVLIRAAESGNVEGVRALLGAGADVNLTVFFGTALTGAAKEGHNAVVKVLLDAGADPTIRVTNDPRLHDTAGMTALELARKFRRRRVVELLEAPLSPAVREPGMTPAWKRLESALQGHRPALIKSLRPGVSAEDLTALAAALGRGLPEKAEEFLKIHDGQSGGKRAAFLLVGDEDDGDKFRFLRATEIVREWRIWKELVEGGEFRTRKSLPDAGVRDDWYNLGWIPLTADGLGDHHCLDLAPSEGGKEGQIILVWHDREERTLVAESLEHWLDQIGQDLS